MSQIKLHNHISRLMALLLALVLFAACLPVAFAAESGTCGDNLQWQFADGVLTITGSGAMTDYTSQQKAPWNHLAGSITHLSLPEGLTSIGNRAFTGCEQLGSITIPTSVKTIGVGAFYRNKSVTTLTLSAGLTAIQRSAFEECTSLVDLRLPETLQTIGNHAFYCCASLSYVSIPASVKNFGSGIFAYCTNLVKVDMNADVNDLPGWSFYGCDKLIRLNVQGRTVDASALKVTTEPVPINPGVVDSANLDTTIGSYGAGAVNTESQHQQTAENITSTEETEIPDKVTMVEKTDDSTIVVDIAIAPEASGGNNKVDITTTIVNPEGWNDVVDMVQGIQGEPEEGKESKPVDVTVYLPGSDVIPESVLQALAGQNATVEVNTKSGVKAVINGLDLKKEDITSDLDLLYTLTRMETVPDGIDSQQAYSLKFHNSFQIKMEVMIRLPLEHTRRNACLFQMGGKEGQEFLQAVLVDGEGYAHFYLASIHEDTAYVIAIDATGAYSDQAIIPDNMYEEYNLVDHSTGKQYKITGRKSSWNMGLGKVMAILAAVMVSAIVVVGAVVFIWNKQRLKNGYVPKWEDDEA